MGRGLVTGIGAAAVVLGVMAPAAGAAVDLQPQQGYAATAPYALTTGDFNADDCGTGRDRVTADRRDRLVRCERARRR